MSAPITTTFATALKGLVSIKPQRSQVGLCLIFLGGISLLILSATLDSKSEIITDRLFWTGCAILIYVGIAWMLARRDQDLAGGHPTSLSFKPNGLMQISGDPRVLDPKSLTTLVSNNILGAFYANPPTPTSMLDDRLNPLPGTEAEAAAMGSKAQELADQNRESLLSKIATSENISITPSLRGEGAKDH